MAGVGFTLVKSLIKEAPAARFEMEFGLLFLVSTYSMGKDNTMRDVFLSTVFSNLYPSIQRGTT